MPNFCNAVEKSDGAVVARKRGGSFLIQCTLKCFLKLSGLAPTQGGMCAYFPQPSSRVCWEMTPEFVRQGIRAWSLTVLLFKATLFEVGKGRKGSEARRGGAACPGGKLSSQLLGRDALAPFLTPKLLLEGLINIVAAGGMGPRVDLLPFWKPSGG